MKTENDLVPFLPSRRCCATDTSHIFPGHPYWETLVAKEELIPCDDELNRLKEWMAEARALRIAAEVRETLRVMKRKEGRWVWA